MSTGPPKKNIVDDFSKLNFNSTEALKLIGHYEVLFYRDQDDMVLYCSPAVEGLLGYTAEECLGEIWHIFAQTDQTQEVLKKRRKATLEKAPSLNYRVEVVCKDGQMKTLDVKEYLSHALDGQVVYMGSCREASIELSPPDFLQDNEQLRVLMENIPGTLYICRNDEQQSALFFGNNIAELTGYSVQDFLLGNIHFSALYHPDDLAMVQQQIEKALENKSLYHFTARIINRAGQIRWVEEKGNGLRVDEETVYIEGLAIDVTSRIEAEQEQKEIERRYRVIFETVKDGVLVLDRQGVVVEFNPGAEKIFGIPRSRAVGKTTESFLHQNGIDCITRHLSKLETEFLFQEDVSGIKQDQTTVILEMSLTSIEVHHSNHLLMTFRDVTEQRHFEKERIWLSSFPEMSPIPVIEVTTGGQVRFFNKVARETFPRLIELGLEHPFLADVVESAARHLENNNPYYEREILFNNRWFCQTIHLVDDGNVIRIYSFDVTSRKAMEDQLRHSSLHDSLTGLSNRSHIQSHIEQAFSNRRQDDSKRLSCLIYFDLDNFKTINDTYGHQVGDEVLIKFAEKMKDCFRKGDTISRIGGDEFAVFIENIGSVTIAENLAKRFFLGLKEPVDISGNPFTFSVSVGIAFVDKKICSPEDLMEAADSAMYKAKNSTKNTYCFYQS